MWLALTVWGCGDGAPPDPTPPDASAASDASADLQIPTDGAADLPADVGVYDGLPSDLGDARRPDAAPLPIHPPQDLTLDAPARLDGPDHRLEWAVDPRPESAIQIKLRAWRFEDGRLWVAPGAREAWVLSDGDAGWRWVLDPQVIEGHGLDARLPPRLLPASDAPWTLSLAGLLPQASGVVEAVRVVDPREPLPTAAPPPAPEATVVEVGPCGAGCDDSASILAAIEAAPEGRVEIRLAGTYTFTHALVVRRPDVHLAGGTVVWDPATDQGWDQPIRFAGGGPGEPAPLVGGHAAVGRAFLVDAPDGWAPTHVQFRADDFGEVPAPCANGRDVERFDRHVEQLMRVESIEAAEGGLRVVTDRPVDLVVPADANPRLVAVDLLPGARVSDMHLVAACPEALVHDAFGDPDCTNPGVVDDRGVVFAWTSGARAERVAAQAFGKEAIVVERALETRLLDCRMDHPARYGSGGQGYGVHTIQASRTLVRGARVEHARHGVVVDFGSSDTQILDGHFSDMNQALVDVHGEASRDTLIRGNTLRDGQQGVIVGGGGHDVHCNDGPRHHLQYNAIEDCRLAGISVSDATRQVYPWFNDVRGGAVLLAAAFGAGDILALRNRFGPAAATTINALGEDTSNVAVWENLFEAVCDPESAALVAAGAEPPDFRDNLWCPDQDE